MGFPILIRWHLYIELGPCLWTLLTTNNDMSDIGLYFCLIFLYRLHTRNHQHFQLKHTFNDDAYFHFNGYKFVHCFVTFACVSLVVILWKRRCSENDTLQWHHNVCNGVSNHRRLDCLLNCLFRRRSKKTSKLHVPVVHREGEFEWAWCNLIDKEHENFHLKWVTSIRQQMITVTSTMNMFCKKNCLKKQYFCTTILARTRDPYFPLPATKSPGAMTQDGGLKIKF